MFKSADPTSKILQNISLKKDKLSYAVADSIGTFFHDKHMQNARRAPAFSVSFDGGTTKRGGLSKDIEMRFT